MTHLITITMHAVAPGEPNGLPDAETNVLLFLADGTSCEGYYDGDHPDDASLPLFRDVDGDALDRDVVTGWSDMPSTGQGTPPAVQRAFAIADEAMFELLQSEGIPGDEYRTVIGFCDESSQEVRTLAEASTAIQDAIEWLQERGYVELAEDEDGEHALVLRRPGEDEELLHG